MKVIIPAAGLGTRLRPHTHHRPKPLMHVAGKTVLGHVLDKLAVLDIDEIVFIVGHLGDQIEAFVAAKYPYPARFVVQPTLQGQAHAIALAGEWIDGPLVVLFVDTIFEADLADLASPDRDGVAFVKEVADPRRFGVVTLDEAGFVTAFVEKPAAPTTNLAVVGLYYIEEGAWLRAAVDRLIAEGRQTKGEYYLTDALQLMVDEGARLLARPTAVWEDCGTWPAILRTNRFLLGQMPADPPAPRPGVVVRPPVSIAPDAVIVDSVVGPFVHVGAGCRIEASVIGPSVSLADGAEVRRSLVDDAIVDAGAQITDATLTGSLVGAGAIVRGPRERLNVGDSSEIDAQGPSISPDDPGAGLV